MPGARPRDLAPPALAALASVAVFAPVLRGFLHADDFCHCFDAANRSLLGFAVQPWGGHVYLFRNAVLWCLVRAFGMAAPAYFASILCLHALNVVLLAGVLRRYGSSPTAAALAAAVWGTSPLLAATLGWISVLGQVLLTTVFLVLLASLERARTHAAAGAREVASWIVLASLASTSFGMGLAVAATLPLLARLCGPPLPPRAPRWIALWLAPPALLALYFVVRARWPSPVGSIVDSTVTLGAAAGSWRYAAAMAGDLVVHGPSALCLGFFGEAVDRASIVRSALAAASGVALVVGAARMDALDRRRTLAAASVALGAYLLVAAGRSTFLALVHFSPEKAGAVARYHYFPLAALVIAFALAARALAPRAERTTALVAVAWIAFAAVGYLRHPPAIDHFDAERRATAAAFEPIRARLAAAPPGATVVVPNADFRPASAVPCDVAGLAGAYLCAHGPDGTIDGRTVRFAVPRAQSDAARARGDRVAALMVPTP